MPFLYTFLRFGVGVIGGGIGALLSVWLLKRDHVAHDPFIEFIYIMGGAIVFGLVGGYIYGIYVLYFSKYMVHVENLVKRTKNPLYISRGTSLEAKMIPVIILLLFVSLGILTGCGSTPNNAIEQ